MKESNYTARNLWDPQSDVLALLDPLTDRLIHDDPAVLGKLRSIELQFSRADAACVKPQLIELNRIRENIEASV